MRPQRVEHALAVFPLLGVTTNPTILRAAEPSAFASDLARLRGLAEEDWSEPLNWNQVVGRRQNGQS